ncbi:MAG: PqqD family peptide modification chaperone [Chlamydiota bacterium]
MKFIGYKDLKSVDILKDVDEGSLNDLDSIATKKTYSTGDYIVKQDEEAETALIIVRGTTEVFRIKDDGEKEEIILMGPSDIIGLGDKASLKPKWRRSASIVALESVTIYEFKVADYILLVEKHPDLLTAFQEISKRMSHYSFIKRLFPFEAFNYRKIRSIANLLIEKKVPKDTTIIREGDISDSCYFIMEGEVEVFHMIEGKKHVLKVFDAGAVIGESALLLNVRRTATVVTTQDSILLEAKGEDLKKIVYQYDDLSDFYVDIVRQRSRPKQLACVEINSGKGESYTLKNTETMNFYQLTEYGYFIWNLLDGEHTIDDLNEKFTSEFGISPGDFVTQLVYDLTTQNFIKDPAASLDSVNDEKEEKEEKIGFLQKIIGKFIK